MALTENMKIRQIGTGSRGAQLLFGLFVLVQAGFVISSIIRDSHGVPGEIGSGLIGYLAEAAGAVAIFIGVLIFWGAQTVAFRRRMSERFPDAVVISVNRSIALDSAYLAAAGGAREKARHLPIGFAAVYNPTGVEFWKGWFAPQRFAAWPWSYFSACEIVQVNDYARRPLALSLIRSESPSEELPQIILGRGIAGLRAQRADELDKLVVQIRSLMQSGK